MGGCMDGDGAAHGHAPEGGGLGSESEARGSLKERLAGKMSLPRAVRSQGEGMIAMGREVEEEAAETRGTKADGDGKVVLLAAAATVKEDESGVVFGADG